MICYVWVRARKKKKFVPNLNHKIHYARFKGFAGAWRLWSVGGGHSRGDTSTQHSML
jgi:hypothetical protein